MMKCPHKNAEAIHAIADGKQTQWARDYNNPIEWNDFDPVWDSSPISSSDGIIWRIKPPEVAQWRKDMAQALDDGKQVMCRNWWTNGESQPTVYKSSAFLDTTIKLMESDYFINPDPKPDVEVFIAFHFIDLFFMKNKDISKPYKGVYFYGSTKNPQDNLKIVIDGETGKLKDAKVLK